ncbi:hypothetical protein D3C73_1275520 [compost metagenome]
MRCQACLGASSARLSDFGRQPLQLVVGPDNHDQRRKAAALQFSERDAPEGDARRQLP